MLNIYLGSSNATSEYTSLKINQYLKDLGAKVSTWNKSTQYDSALPLKSDFLLLIMPNSSFPNGPHFAIGKGQYDQMKSFKDAGRQNDVYIATYTQGAEKFKVLTVDWNSLKVVNSTTWAVGHATFKIRTGEDLKMWHDNESKIKALKEESADLDFAFASAEVAVSKDEWRRARDKRVAEKKMRDEEMHAHVIESYRSQGIVIHQYGTGGAIIGGRIGKIEEDDENLGAAMFLGLI